MSKIEEALKAIQETMGDEDTKLALAQYLGIDAASISEMDRNYYGLASFSVDNGEEYAVATDSDEVFEACKQEIEGLIDEVGVFQALNWDNMGGIENYLDEEYFREAWEELNDNYVSDIIYEGNGRFKDELIQRGFNPEDYGYNEEDDSFEDEEGAIEAFKDSMMKDLEESPYGLIGEFAAQLGDENINFAIECGANLDIDKVTEEVLRLDGAGHILSRYDGDEIEENYEGRTYYIYRLD